MDQAHLRHQRRFDAAVRDADPSRHPSHWRPHMHNHDPTAQPAYLNQVPDAAPLDAAELYRRYNDDEFPYPRPGMPTAVPHGIAEGLYDPNPPALPPKDAAPPLPPQQEQEKREERVAMEPYLSMMCGPMLKYDTVERRRDGDIWHGFAMIVTSDDGSSYDPAPVLTLRYGIRPASRVEEVSTAMENASLNSSTTAVDAPGTTGGTHAGHGRQQPGPGEWNFEVPGERIYVFEGKKGRNSFWRFKLQVQLQRYEMPVRYCINHAHFLEFWVPAVGQDMRWMAHSCNGFSAGVNPDEFNGPDPLWNDVLRAHSVHPLHAVVGGGDQIYADKLAREPEMAEWINSKDIKWKQTAPITEEMKVAIDRFHFNHYCNWFRSGAFGRTISRIPMLNMLDDHDLIDGFGSYPDELQSSAVFSYIGARGYHWYLLFQNFIHDPYDGTPDSPARSGAREYPYKGLIWGANKGPWIDYRSHNFLVYLGPHVYALLLDCRAERKRDRIVDEKTYERVFGEVRKLPGSVQHLCLLLGVPIAYPRMNFLEDSLSSKYNPLVVLGKAASSGFTNKFNGEVELLDDLNDHWTASAHKQERNKMVVDLTQLAAERRMRVSIISGDVHCAAVGRFFALEKTLPEQDPKYILNVVSSAIVNTPPPAAVIGMVNRLASKTHKTLHNEGIDENMVEMFHFDTNEEKLKLPFFMARRNYALIRYDQSKSELEFQIRVETSQGAGTTKGYPVRAPAPLYNNKTA